MEVASIFQLKRELLNLDHSQVVEICLKMAKGTKQAKEQLNYLIFRSHDLDNYLSENKIEIENLVHEVPRNFYFAKKQLRKILKETSKQIKFSGSPRIEIELLIHFLVSCHAAGFNFNAHPIIANMAKSQIKKINKAILKLHEDLQFDYNSQLSDVLCKINIEA